MMQSLREQYGDFDVLKQAKAELDALKNAGKSELERAQQALAEKQVELEKKEREASEAKLQALRLEVGQTKGLSPLLASRLQGATREDLEADAEKVLAEFGPNRPKPPTLNAGAGMGQGDSGTRTVKLTPEQEIILAQVQKTDPKMTRERYIARLLKQQTGD
jgi:hypothetical protein